MEGELQDIGEMEPLPLKSEVLQAMKSIRKEKASGPDVRSGELLKFGDDTAVNIMHDICCSVLFYLCSTL